MEPRIRLQQPLLGLLGTLLTTLVSLAICLSFDAATFNTWVAFLVMAATPAQIVIGLVWHGTYPAALQRLGQPARGLAILVLMAVAAAVVAPLVLAGIGGGVAPPTPFAIMYEILSVVFTLWMVVVFQCWPFAALSKHPAVVGLGTLALGYGVAWLVFRVFFNFEFLAGAPVYVARLDPHGMFMAFASLSFVITTVSVIMGFVLMDFWPVAALARRLPALGRQPVLGLVAAAMVLGGAALIWSLSVRGFGMDLVVYLVRVPVSIIFGEFIMLILMQTAPLQAVVQPLKGCVLFVMAAVVGIALCTAYDVIARAVIPGLAGGPPAYDLELWLASAMLGITFPVIVAYGDGFGCWPLVRRQG